MKVSKEFTEASKGAKKQERWVRSSWSDNRKLDYRPARSYHSCKMILVVDDVLGCHNAPTKEDEQATDWAQVKDKPQVKRLEK